MRCPLSTRKVQGTHRIDVQAEHTLLHFDQNLEIVLKNLNASRKRAMDVPESVPEDS